MSEEKKKGIWEKLLLARRSIKNPPLDCVNPHFKNRYASLAATLNEVNKSCLLWDIVYIQTLVRAEDGYELQSKVVDDEGSAIQLSSFPVTVSSNVQAFGSELTYKKRQQAQMDWGIVGEEDDDGESAVQAPIKPQQKTERDPRLNSVRELYAKALAAGIKREGIDRWMSSNLQISLDKLGSATDAQVSALVAYLNARIADMEELKGEAA